MVRERRIIFTLVFLLSFLEIPVVITTSQQASAQTQLTYANRARAVKPANYRNRQHNRSISRVNKGTVGIITGDIGGTYMRIAADLAAVLDSNRDPRLRLLPISGRGGVANIEDLLYLRGVDLAIVQSDILNHMERDPKYKNIRQRIKYIIKLFDSELHIITRENIKDISQLQGKKVNFRYKGSSSDLTGKAILEAFNVTVIPTYFDQSLALEKIKKGELAASIVLAGKPSSIYSLIPPGSGLRLLPINFSNNLDTSYLPANFTHKDYPGLIKKGEQVPTIASSTVLAVYNWPQDSRRYKKVALMVYNLFTYIADFKKPERHRKWMHTSPLAKVPGWKRFQPAQKWIDNSFQFFTKRNASTAIFTLTNTTSNNIGAQTVSSRQRARLFKQFTSYLRQFGDSEQLKKMDDSQLAQLFEGFLRWRARNN